MGSPGEQLIRLGLTELTTPLNRFRTKGAVKIEMCKGLTTEDMTWQETEQAIKDIISELRERFSSETLKELSEEVEAGEYDICLELILHWLIWFDKPIPRTALEAIRTLGTQMELTPKGWDYLRSE